MERNRDRKTGTSGGVGRLGFRSLAGLVAVSLAVAALIALPLACSSDDELSPEDGTSALPLHSIPTAAS